MRETSETRRQTELRNETHARDGPGVTAGRIGPVAGSRSPEEKRAYRFAGAFLLPEEVVRTRVSETLNLHGYLPIKADYGISVGAIVMRARDLGVISADRARSLQIQLSSQGWRRHEPVAVPDEDPLLLRQALRKAFGDQAVAKASHALGVAPRWILRWTHEDSPDLTDARSTVVDLDAARRRRVTSADLQAGQRAALRAGPGATGPT